MDLVLLKYNNYYNKIVKKEDFLVDYTLMAQEHFEILPKINFNPNDNVSTEQIINWNENWTPDYLLVYNDGETKYNYNLTDHINWISAVYPNGSDKSIEGNENIVNSGYFNRVTKTFNLEHFAYTDDYSLINVSIEGEIPLNDFSVKITNCFCNRIEISGDQNFITIIPNAVDTDIYLTKDILVEKYGWQDDEAIWSIDFKNSSPDGLGQITFLDYNNKYQPVARWFVTHTQRTRSGQYKLSLVRDLLVDNYNDYISAPAFIEKATVDEQSDLIFNKEGFKFNQIKVDEISLKDQTDTPWIVGYLPENIQGKSGEFNISDSVAYSYEFDSSEWEYRSGSYISVDEIDSWKTNINYSTWNSLTKDPIGYDFISGKNIYQGHYYDSFGIFSPSASLYNGIVIGDRTTYTRVFAADKSGWFSKTELKSKLSQHLGGISNEALNNLLNLNGKIVRFTDGVFLVRVSNIQSGITGNQTITKGSGATLNGYFTDKVYNHIERLNSEGTAVQIHNNLKGNIQYKYRSLRVNLEPLNAPDLISSYRWNIPATGNQLVDNPYKMFAIPLSGVKIGFNRSNFIQTNTLVNLEAAMDISRALVSSQEIYDLQILPYCPITGITRENGVLKLPSDFVSGVDYTYITYGTASNARNESIIIFPKKSTFNFMIHQELPVYDYKISNECDMYRVCSPNYAGAFEFSPAMNRGVSTWNVYCTYKPYNPYIQVSPAFDGLYGKNYNDFRGLICAGDFSLPLVDDAWTTYELNNKNYQNTFDRQIQNLQTMNDLAVEQATWQASLGAVNAGVQGATMGMMATGSPWGALTGVATGLASGIAGAADINILKRQQAETLSYTKDTFTYQLQNIQALPSTLSKVSSLTANYKFYPFIEKYTCSNEERESFKQYLEYNGMSVGVISNIASYLQPGYSFIKAQLIRCENSAMNTHEILELASRLSEGVYIK